MDQGKIATYKEQQIAASQRGGADEKRGGSEKNQLDWGDGGEALDMEEPEDDEYEDFVDVDDEEEEEKGALEDD